MRLLLACYSIALLFAPAALANTEKTIFVAPPAITLPDTGPSLDALKLDTLTSTRPNLRRAISAAFPTESAPRGLDSWYLLQGLHQGQRYEVRVCWTAVQPTDFWLDVYNISHVFDTPHLIQSLADFADSKASQAVGGEGRTQEPDDLTGTILFLHVQAAADYFTTNKTLMQFPPPVDVEIILDPYLANIVPASLLPTAIYIIALSVGSWLLSGQIWNFLKPQERKERTE